MIGFKELLKGTVISCLALSPLVIIFLIWQGESQAYEISIADYIKVYFGLMVFVGISTIASYYFYRFSQGVFNLNEHS